MFCPTCGATAQPGQKFCMNCGTSLALVAAQRPAPPPPPPGMAGGPANQPSANPRPAVRRVEPGSAAYNQPYEQAYGALTAPVGIVEQTTATTYATNPIWPPANDQWPTSIQPALSAEPFDVGPLVVGAVLAAGLGIVGSLIKVGSSEFGQQRAHFSISDLASNAVAAMIAAAVVLVIGAVLAVSGRRIGAGLAGGAGLAVAGVVAIDVALAKLRFDGVEKQTVGDGTLTITYEVGFYLLIAAGVIGLIVFLVSLSAGGDDHRPRLNPIIGIVGVLGTVAVVVGPLVPLHGAAFSDNVSTDSLPALFVYLRLAALVVLLLGGVVGFVSNRRWGSALALGATSSVVALWITSLSSDKSGASARVGVGIFNPGAINAEPYIAVTVGLIVMMVAGVAGLIIGSATASDAQTVS
jgi:hypothetical protein